MLGDLSQDLIGTDPKYPKIVNHGWLDVNPATYDNYPSDNNSVRIQPKLSQLWNHEPQPMCVIPNATVQPLGVMSSVQVQKDTEKAVQSLVREAKKAIMSGLKGKALADHIRSRFQAKYVEAAKPALEKLSSEIGLLGNVYIDASAFSTYEEAAKFLSQHRNRLSQDILFDAENMNPSVVARLASEFRKKIVTSMDYDENTLNKYKAHLVASGKIPADFEVSSKDTLRSAFLYETPKADALEPKEEQKLSADDMTHGLDALAMAHAESDASADEGILLKKIMPVLALAQESYSKGKDSDGVKEILRKKFSTDDIKASADILVHIAKTNGLSVENIKVLELTPAIEAELTKLAKKYPIKSGEWNNVEKRERQIGVPGYFYAMTGKTQTTMGKAIEKSVEAMRKGLKPETVRVMLLQARLSKEDANRVMSEAMNQFNLTPAGMIANKAIKSKKVQLVADPAPKATLPDPSTIMPQMKEMHSFFQRADQSVDVGSRKKFDVVEIGETFNREGLDSVL